MESFGPNNCLIPEFIISKTISDDFQGYKKALNQIYISKLICPILGPKIWGQNFKVKLMKILWFWMIARDFSKNCVDILKISSDEFLNISFCCFKDTEIEMNRSNRSYLNKI